MKSSLRAAIETIDDVAGSRNGIAQSDERIVGQTPLRAIDQLSSLLALDQVGDRPFQIPRRSLYHCCPLISDAPQDRADLNSCPGTATRSSDTASVQRPRNAAM